MICCLHGKDRAILSARDDALCPPAISLWHLIIPLLTRLVWSKWLDVGQVPVFVCYGQRQTLCVGINPYAFEIRESR